MVVAVRYYLDLPGYDVSKSSLRFWKNAGDEINSDDLLKFLKDEGIVHDENMMIVEVLLEEYSAYISLDAYDGSIPGDKAITVRLTEKNVGGEDKQPQHACNMSPVGLFAFSLTMGLEAIDLTEHVVGSRIEPNFVLTWGPYAFFVSGLLQLIVGLFEAARNNVYGATAFSSFGCFWLSNGLKLIMQSYFPADIPEDLASPADDWGTCIRTLYIAAFVCVLFKQTLALNKISTVLIGLLIINQFSASFAPFNTTMEWLQMVTAWIVSIFAFYAFTAEFTNEVYHREVFDLYPWKESSPDEVFAAAGRASTLHLKALQLRAAHHARQVATGKAALPPSSKHALRDARPAK